MNFKIKNHSETRVPYRASLSVKKYFRKWLKENGIKQISIGNFLYQAEFELDKEVILTKKKTDRENFICYKVGETQKYIEFVNCPRPKIIIHEDENYSERGYCIDYNPKQKKVTLLKCDELVHKVYDDSFQLRQRVISSGNLLTIKFIYAISAGAGVEFSLTDYDYNKPYDFTKKNNIELQKYLRKHAFPELIQDTYSDICKLFAVSTNNNDVSLKIYNALEHEYRAFLDIYKNKLSIKENKLELDYEKKENKTEIKVGNKEFKFLIEYENKDKTLDNQMDYKKEEPIIKYLLSLKSPIQVVNIYKELCKNNLLSPKKYSKLTLKEEHGINNSTTLKFVNGEIEKIEVMEDGQLVETTNNNFIVKIKEETFSKYLCQSDIRKIDNPNIQLRYILGGFNSKDHIVCTSNKYWSCDVKCGCTPVEYDDKFLRVKDFIRKHNISNSTFLRLLLTYINGYFYIDKKYKSKLIRELESIVEDYNLECINDFKEDNFEGMDILKQITELKGYETLKEFFVKYSLTIEDFITLAKTSLHHNYRVGRSFDVRDLPADLIQLLSSVDISKIFEVPKPVEGKVFSKKLK